jgi:hypothetical protein
MAEVNSSILQCELSCDESSWCQVEHIICRNLSDGGQTEIQLRHGVTPKFAATVCKCSYGMSIAIVRATQTHIRGSRIPTGKMCNRLPHQWEDKAGLGLFRLWTSTAPTQEPPLQQLVHDAPSSI